MSKKRKQRSGKAAVAAKRDRILGKEVRYKCLDCGIEEDIPRSVVEMFDALDDDGDITVPPRFDCKECGGLMEPIHYAGVHNIEYTISDKPEWFDDEDIFF